jgi:hypothetical protein
MRFKVTFDPPAPASASAQVLEPMFVDGIPKTSGYCREAYQVSGCASSALSSSGAGCRFSCDCPAELRCGGATVGL